MSRVQSLQFVGQNGSAIELFYSEDFYIADIEGFSSLTADVASSTTPSVDGDTVNMIQVQPRDIILTLLFKHGVDVEQAKRRILRTVKPKLKGKLRMLHDERDVEIEGVVTSVTMPRFSNQVAMQITLHCSIPYWQDAQFVAVELSRAIDKHYFPQDMGGLAFPVEGIVMGEYNLNMTHTYTNEGDVDCGMVITIIALGNVTNPTIYKSDGTFIGVDDTMVSGDQIVINTNKGQKSIVKNGASIFSKVRAGSEFFSLDVGDNEITIDSDGGTEGNMYFTLSFKRRFV